MNISPTPNRKRGIMSYKIEKNIPITRLHIERGSKYPFEKMEVGDSFKVTGGKGRAASVRTAASTFVARKKTLPHGIKIQRQENRRKGNTLLANQIRRTP